MNSILEIFQRRNKHTTGNTDIYPKPIIADFTKNAMNAEERALLVLDGILAGDVIGHPYEGLFEPPCLQDPDTADLVTDRCNYSDDSILSFAVMHAAFKVKETKPGTRKERVAIYRTALRQYTRAFPEGDYGSYFLAWATNDDAEDNDSYGNGGAMRAGVIGAVFDDYDDVVENAVCSALPSHSHEEGVKGAVVTAAMVWMGFHGATKDEIVDYACRMYPNGFRNVEEYIGLPMMTPLNPKASIKEMQDLAGIAVSLKSWITVPEAVVNFNNSDNFESCIRNIMRYASDSDTVGAICGGIAAAFYKNTDLGSEEENDRMSEFGHVFKERMQAIKEE